MLLTFNLYKFNIKVFLCGHKKESKHVSTIFWPTSLEQGSIVACPIHLHVCSVANPTIHFVCHRLVTVL